MDNEYWRDKDGNDIPIEDLEDGHLKNILRMLNRSKEKDIQFINLANEARRRKIVWR